MSAATITTQHTVGQLVSEKPSRSRVFEKLGIDYCCGGKKTLAEACAGKGLDAATIAAVLDSDAIEPGGAGLVDAASMSMTALCDHIEATHHAYLRVELPRLAFLTTKVASRHGERDARLQEVAEVFAALHAEMDSHMMKEEQILFPLIRALDAATDGAPPSHCGSINNPIRVMEHEHDSAGGAVARMRILTDGFTPPMDACNTYRAMLDSLAQLERDLHQHVHKENNVLFPRAAARERELAQ